jgi:cobalt/nickel transport system permease protein
MHMADALLSPVVGGAMWGASAITVAYCARRLRNDPDERRVPLMGVLGAFLFAAQMINFSIPGTGSSGHLAGGLLLAILLGPHAGFLVMASVLIVQALFFADGGLLALGCNIFNLGFFAAFVGYPLYRSMCGTDPGTTRAGIAAVVAAVVSLQLGAFAVVLETVASGISALPFDTFVLFMLPIHLAIGIVEGLVTAAVVTFVRTTRPEVLPEATSTGMSVRGVAIAFLALALGLGAVGARYAAEDPDGLEWSVAKVAGSGELEGERSSVHGALEAVQQKVAILPDYDFRKRAESGDTAASVDENEGGWGTSVSGVVGGVITLVVAVLAGTLLAPRARRSGNGLR